jgi:hypothetical protein
MFKQPGMTAGEMQGMRLSTWDHGGIIAGLEFWATLQLRTPLRVLRWHGTLHTNRDSPPPCVVEAQWEGIWMIKTRSWKDLGGVDIPEFEPTTAASDIGPVKPSEYFPYLLGIHEISESDQPRGSKEAALRAFLACPEWSRFNSAHGGAAAVIARVLP